MPPRLRDELSKFCNQHFYVRLRTVIKLAVILRVSCTYLNSEVQLSILPDKSNVNKIHTTRAHHVSDIHVRVEDAMLGGRNCCVSAPEAPREFSNFSTSIFNF